MPPQYYILFTLSQLLSGRVNTQEQRDQVESLSRGAFGNMSINPKLLRNGRYNVVLTYEGDETRGGPPGRLHRALVKFEKGGVSVSMAFIQPNQLTPCLGMQRNRTSTELRHIQGLWVGIWTCQAMRRVFIVYRINEDSESRWLGNSFKQYIPHLALVHKVYISKCLGITCHPGRTPTQTFRH